MCIRRVALALRQPGKNCQCIAGREALTTRGNLAANHRVGLGHRQSEQPCSKLGIHAVIVPQQPDRPPPDAGDGMSQ